MQFDIRTLLVTVALAAAFCAVARIALCWRHPTIPGLADWAWASVLAPVALTLLALRGIAIADGLAMSLAQLLIAAGFALSWDGFRRFLHLGPLPLPVMAAVAAGALAPILGTQFVQGLALRAAGNAALVAVLSAFIARDLWFGAARDQLAARATAWIYAANALFFAVRVAAVFAGAEVPGTARSSGVGAASLLWWLGMTIGVTLGMVLMTSERLQRDLDRQASRDPLTGALNRRAFAMVAEKELALARRGGQPVAVLMTDLDHFKQINDRLGHAGGDAILRLFVAVAGKVLRGEDVFCRFGGEEFVALLPGSSAAQALAVAERLRMAYAREAAGAVVAGQSLAVALSSALTVSVGVAEMVPDEDLEDAIGRADKALYRAKEAGRNRSELATGLALQSPNEDVRPEAPMPA